MVRAARACLCCAAALWLVSVGARRGLLPCWALGEVGSPARARDGRRHAAAGGPPGSGSPAPAGGPGALPGLLAGAAALRLGLRSRRTAVPRCAKGGESSIVQKFFGTVPDWSVGIHGVVITLLRVTAAVMMIHHGNEGGFWPASSPEALKGFTDFVVKPYLGWLPVFDSTTWAIIHDYVEFWASWLLLVGFLTRPAAFALFGTMCLAVYFHLASTGLQGFPFGHVENYSYNFEEPALYAMIFLMFAVNGPGPFAVDTLLKPED